MYAVHPQTLPAPVSLRLIGVLDADLVAAFGALERGLVGRSGATIVVDVRDVDVLGEAHVDGLVRTIAGARAEGRDVRLDGRSFPWRRAVKTALPAQPPVDAHLRAAVRRTVILAHRGKHPRR